MKRFACGLLAVLAMYLCFASCAEGSVCIGADGGISFEHSYRQGVCTDCGNVFADCPHANAVSAGASFEKMEKLGAEGHARTYFYSDTCGFCPDCGSVLVDGAACDVPESQYSYVYEAGEHVMKNSVCLECGYIQVGCFKKY